MENKTGCLFYVLSLLMMLSGILILITGVYQYNLDPNKLTYAYHRNDGFPSTNFLYSFEWYAGTSRAPLIQSSKPGFDIPSAFSEMFSCSAILNGFYKNE